MARIAFKMQLFEGYEEEYKRRHQSIWPELHALLKQSGISEYSIYLDPATLALIAVMQASDPAVLEGLPAKEVMQRWWLQMRDIMESHPDNSPVTIPLQEVFYMP